MLERADVGFFFQLKNSSLSSAGLSSGSAECDRRGVGAEHDAPLLLSHLRRTQARWRSGERFHHPTSASLSSLSSAPALPALQLPSRGGRCSLSSRLPAPSRPRRAIWGCLTVEGMLTRRLESRGWLRWPSRRPWRRRRTSHDPVALGGPPALNETRESGSIRSIQRGRYPLRPPPHQLRRRLRQLSRRSLPGPASPLLDLPTFVTLRRTEANPFSPRPCHPNFALPLPPAGPSSQPPTVHRPQSTRRGHPPPVLHSHLHRHLILVHHSQSIQLAHPLHFTLTPTPASLAPPSHRPKNLHRDNAASRSTTQCRTPKATLKTTHPPPSDAQLPGILPLAGSGSKSRQLRPPSRTLPRPTAARRSLPRPTGTSSHLLPHHHSPLVLLDPNPHCHLLSRLRAPRTAARPPPRASTPLLPLQRVTALSFPPHPTSGRPNLYPVPEDPMGGHPAHRRPPSSSRRTKRSRRRRRTRRTIGSRNLSPHRRDIVCR